MYMPFMLVTIVRPDSTVSSLDVNYVNNQILALSFAIRQAMYMPFMLVTNVRPDSTVSSLDVN